MSPNGVLRQYAARKMRDRIRIPLTPSLNDSSEKSSGSEDVPSKESKKCKINACVKSTGAEMKIQKSKANKANKVIRYTTHGNYVISFPL